MINYEVMPQYLQPRHLTAFYSCLDDWKLFCIQFSYEGRDGSLMQVSILPSIPDRYLNPKLFDCPFENDITLLLDGYSTKKLHLAIGVILEQYPDVECIRVSRNENSIILSPMLPRTPSLLMQYQKGLI